MITKHRFIDAYPISNDSKKLIIGTIHPHDHQNFCLPFFYGNVMSLWNILSDAFPHDLNAPLTLTNVLAFLSKNKISLSDTILECERTSPTALDKDLIPIKLNWSLIEQIRASQINHIYFTSGFGKNNAFKLFYNDILGLKITSKIRKDRRLLLDKSVFGREIKLTILYSPSGSSNVGLSKSKLYQDEKLKYVESRRPVYDFKVDYYKKLFSEP